MVGGWGDGGEEVGGIKFAERLVLSGNDRKSPGEGGIMIIMKWV